MSAMTSPELASAQLSAAATKAWSEWPTVFEKLAPRLIDVHGFLDNVIRNTRNNQVDGIPVLVLDADSDWQIVFSSRGLEATIGWKSQVVVGKQGIDFLRLKPEAMHDTLNRKVWADVDALKAKLLSQGSSAVQPKPMTELVVSATANGIPFWNLMDIVPLEGTAGQGSRCRYLAFVLLRLEAPVPRAIFHEGAIDAALATALVETARNDLASTRRNTKGPWGTATPEDVVPPLLPQFQNELAGTLLQAAEIVRRELVHIHEDAQEGDHYVPKLGWASVEAFDRMNTLGRVAGKVQEEILTAWSGSDEELACLVSDPRGVDCPIVFASEGFEELTGYKRMWALGRNCRFLQPNSQRTNMAVNRNEFRRLRDFCRSKSPAPSGSASCMLSLLLNERSDGRHFWNVLYLQHIHPNGEEGSAGSGRYYIFGVLTSAAVQKDALDMLVLQELAGPGTGEKALQLLRDKLRKREERFRPSKQALLDLMTEVSLAWVRESGRGIGNFWERSLFVPRVGVGAAQEFSAVWPQLVDGHAPTLQEQLGIADDALNCLRANKDMKAICVVSDPLGMDCPLVFLSRAFQEATGYDAAFSLGRNCRFLQPSTPGMNEAVNGEELAAIRYFCSLRGQYAANAPPHVALLLNQKRTGERFWSLAHLNHITVGGRPYILATYMLLLGVPMPALIKDSFSSEAVLHHDEVQLLEFNNNLGGFCYGLRQELRNRGHQGAAPRERAESSTSDEAVAPVGSRVAAMASLASQALKDYMQSCQHSAMPPESPQALSSLAERFDVIAWSKTLEELTHTSQLYGLFVRETTGAGFGGVRMMSSGSQLWAASLADPKMEDCPLVYVSAEFEEITGHSRQTSIGQNCRFLQPKDVNMNNLLNRGELERIKDFCAKPHTEGARLMTLLVNVECDGYPFWHFLVMEQVVAEGRQYILSVSHRVEHELGRLSELLAMDSDSILELDRLRRGLQQRESLLFERGPTVLMEDAIAAWIVSFPPYFELPVFEAGGPGLWRPSVSLELNAKSDLPRIFPDAIEEGIRHFHLSFEGDIQVGRDDNRVTGLTGQLFALRLAELMMSGEKRRFDFLRGGIRFTIVTPPSFVAAFAELHKVLNQCRYDIDCWMLDCRGATVQSVREAWQAMSRAVRAGEAGSLGLWAVTRQARDAIASMPGAERVSVASIDMHAGKELEHPKEVLLQDLRSQGVEIEAHNVFGFRDHLLTSPAVKQQASNIGMDPAMLLMKWAEAQDFVSVVPYLRASSVPSKEEIAKLAGAGAGAGTAGAASPPVSAPGGGATAEKEDIDAQPVNVHRNFVREYHNSRSAEDCATRLETSALSVEEKNASTRRGEDEMSCSPKLMKAKAMQGIPRSPLYQPDNAAPNRASFETPSSLEKSGAGQGGGLDGPSGVQSARNDARRYSERSEGTSGQEEIKRDLPEIDAQAKKVPTPPDRPGSAPLAGGGGAGGGAGNGGSTGSLPAVPGAAQREAPPVAPSAPAGAGASGAASEPVSPKEPMKVVAPTTSPRPPSGRRFVRPHHSAAGAAAIAVDESSEAAPGGGGASDEVGGAASASSPSDGEAAQDAQPQENVSKALARLKERGWNAQEIAELFDMDVELVAAQLARM